ncbi:MAG TPA: DEAD/DEAH box helicase family protein [Terriglobales bacterium]|nr:DEAD/DEAH box helicase family protein [Terriglobales bacterium]
MAEAGASAAETKTIPELIICSPYTAPGEHWRYVRESQSFRREPTRRPAGYVKATPNAQGVNDPGVFVPLPLVNQIRERVAAWRDAGYAGVTGTTRRLLEHWLDPEQRPSNRRLFFCQLEAIETLIWLAEAPAAARQGVNVPGDGGAFLRYCSKMATGTGKTAVMAMLIAWQALNKVAAPQDKRFSKNFLVVAPGLTVKSRLQVLVPAGAGNFYAEFELVPAGLRDQLRQARVLIHNWHALAPLDPAAGPRVRKLGPESDEAYATRVLGPLAAARRWVVINDEAHHAWRKPAGTGTRGIGKDEIEEATVWVGGLDRIHQRRQITACYDLTATPFAPGGGAAGEESLYGWVVSDFGLNDAIESGLVKTPRVVVRDDGKAMPREFRSRLYHVYNDPEVKDDLNRKALPEEPLPPLVLNAYLLLGRDWEETRKRWKKAGARTPPVLITVANRTETAARIERAFARKRMPLGELTELCAPGRMLHIDSRVLAQAEAQSEAAEEDKQTDLFVPVPDDDAAPAKRLTRQEQAERLRRQVDTIGHPGEPGEQIQNVISVGMLSEGWDARTVTHILGLRAFTSQLLCEQVVGRGLRRTEYDVDPASGRFRAEYVNIFGVPFSFLPHEGGEDLVAPPAAPQTRIEALAERAQLAIAWPNVVRVNHELGPHLRLDAAKLRPLFLDSAETTTVAELAPVVEGKPHLAQWSRIELEDFAQRFRMQKLIFEAAASLHDQFQSGWHGGRELLLAQLVALVEEFMRSGAVVIEPELLATDELTRRLVMALHIPKVVQHVRDAVICDNTERLALEFDPERPLRSTGDMPAWHTSRPCHPTERSQINFCVFDSGWEATEAFALERDPQVAAWAKNDHLGFEVIYSFAGVTRKYRPDFLVRLRSGATAVLEVKGREDAEARAKRAALAEWVRGVNADGRFGRWTEAVSRHPKDLAAVLAAAAH